MKPKPWDRKLWGVSSGALLVSTGWDDGYQARRSCYDDEPRMPLLFRTRAGCRAWIKAQPRRTFTLRPVRVRERVEVCDD